jgi:hypothetical protein
MSGFVLIGGSSRLLADQLWVIDTVGDARKLCSGCDRGVRMGRYESDSGVENVGAASPVQGGGVTVNAAISKDELWNTPMLLVEITGWPSDEMQPEVAVHSPGNARLTVWTTDPSDDRALPTPAAGSPLVDVDDFSLMNSGNRTLRASKRSWKVGLEGSGDDAHLAGMTSLNLKAMYNDPSQMREALAWRLFGQTGVPAARHTYVKLGINGAYRGLFSMIEQVDKRFLKDHFGKNDEGNLYKAYCGDVGCATLEHRVGPDGDDSGRQYFTPGNDDLTYRLKTNEHDPGANTYDDLAAFVRTVNATTLVNKAADPFDTDAYRESMENIMNVQAFLRWAGVNMLIGSWDNYFATPANYYLYNSGRQGGERRFMESPYFTFLPWDYDNSFGIDYFGTRWQYTDLVDWASNTFDYCSHNHTGHATSRIPLVQNVLRNHDFCQYYLDHVEHLLDTVFTPAEMTKLIGPDGGGLWDRVSRAGYLEADSPNGLPFTGRQFTNDEVYRCNAKQYELQKNGAKIEGIVHYTEMRCDSARERLTDLRKVFPSGASQANFPAASEPLPSIS